MYSKNIASKILSLILVIALMTLGVPALSASSLSKAAYSGKLLLATMSDIHYYASSLKGNGSAACRQYVEASNVSFDNQQAIMDSAFNALAKQAAEGKLKYLVITGDLTVNGEYESHIELAKYLKAFEDRTGVEVFVMAGNHDINNSNGTSFADDTAKPAQKTTPEDFMAIYEDFGYDTSDKSINRFTPSGRRKAGMLSYSVSLEGGYRLISIDAGRYSWDSTESGNDEHETRGKIGNALMTWILGEISAAKTRGETPIGATHWNMSGMNYMHEYLLQGFVIDNSSYVSETLADAGMNFVFSGHQHTSDINITYSDSGQPMYSIITPSIDEFPFFYRETQFTRDSRGTVTANFRTLECDNVFPVVSSGKTYDKPFMYEGFAEQYCGPDAAEYLTLMCRSMLGGYIDEIKDCGSIVKFAESKLGDSLKNYIYNLILGYLDDMIKSGTINYELDTIFGIKNPVSLESLSAGPIAYAASEFAMLLINDIDRQLTAKYIANPEYTFGLIEDTIRKITDTVVSDVPCTKFIDTYGFGSTEHGGTIGDLMLSTMVYMYVGNEDISDDLFVQDFLESCLDGSFCYTLIDTLSENVVKGLLLDEILDSVKIDSGIFLLLPLNTDVQSYIREYVNLFLKIVANVIDADIQDAATPMDGFLTFCTAMSHLDGDASINWLISFILGLGAAKSYGTDIDSIVNTLVDSYVTTSQAEIIGYMAWKVINGCLTDDELDNNVTYIYKGADKSEVDVSAESMRLPSNITLSFGEDAASSYIINWYTRYSVTGSDIEIYKAGAKKPVFTGKAHLDSGISAAVQTTPTVRQIMGADIGLFGILPYELNTQRHIITLTGLEAGSTYYYRIGDASKGWWSDTGTLSTSGNDNSFTFLHVTDNQSGTPMQYETWGKLLKDAAGITDFDFLLHSGDFVDDGDNFKQWQWGLNSASDTLLSKPIMAVSGNHEAYGTDAQLLNYAYKKLPMQYTDTGIYYSFDYENAHYVMLNSNYLGSNNALAEQQINWMKKDLQASDATWKIVVLHKGPYSIGEHFDDDDVKAIRAQIVPLMYEYNVDLVLSGHDHVYVRTDPIIGNGTVDSGFDTDIVSDNSGISYVWLDVDGAVYITNGAAGVKDYKQDKDGVEFMKGIDPTAKAIDTQYAMFSAITIENGLLKYKAYSYNNTGKLARVDAFAIQKPQITVMVGDVDDDGAVTAADARLALRHAVKLEGSCTGRTFVACDADFDGHISSYDARAILRCAVKLEVIDPAYVTVYTDSINPQ